MNKRVLQIGGWVIVLGIGFAIGWYTHPKAAIQAVNVLRESSSGYKFINPALLVQVPTEDTSPQFSSLKNKITSYTKTALSEKTATKISAYYRELNSDKWTSVNGSEKYSPASMLKVASMIAFFRAVEERPTLYNSSVRITDNSVDTNTRQDYYPSPDPVKVGETYTASDLLSRMVINSDNNAAFVINYLTGDIILKKTYSDLGLPLEILSAGDIESITPGRYSRLFRTLYNGTYLSRESSEKALNLLSKTTFTDGLQAGIPKDILVSHKFGERTIVEKDTMGVEADRTTHELHDCGIIYFPDSPYFLCVMTAGNDFPSLQNIIKDISKITWDTTLVNNQKK